MKNISNLYILFLALDIFIICKIPIIKSYISNYSDLIKKNTFGEETRLNPGILYRQFSFRNSSKYFTIKLDNIENIKNLEVYFTVISGNADIYIFSDEDCNQLIENKNFRYAYKKEIIEITENFFETYYIFIKLYESSFFEIKYEINLKEKILLNNEINTEYINKAENYKKYIIKTEEETNYLLIQSLDCSLTFKNGDIEEKNITSKYYEFSEKQFEINLRLENYFHTVYDDTEDCTLFIATGTSNSKKIPLITAQNIKNPSSFINNYYKFPFVYDDYFKGIFINIEFDSQLFLESTIYPEIKVSFSIEEAGYYEAKIIHKSKLFFIKSNIEKFCKLNNLYYLQIQLERKDSFNYITYTSIQLSSQTPIYVNKNQVYNEKLFPRGGKYYYTQIDKAEEGEINIMFNKGYGEIFAKIFEKNNFEENPNWNRRINLPDETSKNLLEFDSIGGSLKYYAYNHNNCSNGCELYFLVKGIDSFENENLINEFSFSIDKKRKEIGQNGVINLLLNNYIKGNLTQNIYKYYTFTIDYDITKVCINFYCPYGKLYVKLGKGHIANEESHDWELIRKSDGNNRIIISSNDEIIRKNSLKNLSFSLGIILSDLHIDENNIKKYYFLQVQTLHNDIISYYHLQSERSIICNTNEFTYCHILVPISDLYDNRNTVIYSYSINNEESKINIYSKFYYENEIDSISYIDSISEKFPNQKKYDQNSNGEKYLVLDNKKINLYSYILLTIDSFDKNNLIKIILGSSLKFVKEVIPPFTERLLYINYNQQINFTIIDTNKLSQNYTLKLKTLSGISEINLGENDYYSELDGNCINELSPKYETPLKINNIYNKKPNIMVISFSQRRKDIREYDLIKNINNEISFSLTENPFPQYGFIDMKNKNIKVNIYFYDIKFKKYSRSRVSQNLFNIYAMVIPDDGNTFDVPGNYLIYENIGIMDFKLNCGRFKDGGYYIYTFIEKQYKNENVYEKIKEQITISEIENNNEIKIFSKSKYFYSLNDNENIINLILDNKNKNNKIFLIDITQEIPVLNNFNFELRKNDNSIIKKYKSYEYMGRRRIILDISKYNEDNNNIKLKIERIIKENNSFPTNITILYHTFENISSIFEYKDFDNTFYIQESEIRKNITFKNIQYYYKSIINVIYFIDIFNITENCSSYEKINTVFLGNRDNQNLVFSNILDWLNSDYQSYTQYIPKDLDFDKNKYLIRIVATFKNSKGFEERIIYKIKEDKKDNPSSNSFKYFPYIFIAIVIIAIIIIFSIYLSNKKKIKNEKIEPIANFEDSRND